MKNSETGLGRRKFIKRALVGTAAGAAALSLEERILLAGVQDGGPEPSSSISPGEMPMGKIGDLEISRMICGGNLIGGYSHARDLVYVSELMKQYNTEERVMDTLELCERNGINAVLTNPSERAKSFITKYWKERGGKIKWIVDSRPQLRDIKERLKMAIDLGAAAIYVNGGWAERWVEQGKVEMLGKVVEFIKQNGLPGGIGAHRLEVPVACEKAGIKVDFYMKTLHSRKYWSADPEKEHDNIWCRKPEETIEFMKNVEAPWIGYKVLAAGAINPTTGFKYALRNGADFLCVGMFDFQVEEDVRIFKGLMARGIERDRPWRA